MNSTGLSTQMANSPPRMSASRRLFAIGLTFLVILIIGVGALEIIFRLFVPVIDVAYVFWDPVVGLRRAPNQSGRNITGRYVNAHYNFNAQGWNNEHDYTTPKPAGTRRICVVGDSQVQSYEVDVDKTFFSQAERIMSKPDHPVQWYSFGCSGFGYSQEAAVIHHYVLDYHPDLVLLLFVENDPHDSSPYIYPVENFITSYYLGPENELVLLEPQFWQRSGLRRLMSSMALSRYFFVQKDIIHRQQGDAFAIGGIYLREGAKSAAGKNLHQVPGLEKMSIEDRERTTWVIIEKVMQQIRDECRAHGAKFALLYRGHTRILEAARNGEAYTPAPKSADPYCLRKERLFEMGTDYLEPIAKRLDIPYLDLTGPLREIVLETKQPHVFIDDGHWNGTTHTRMAKALADWSERLLQTK
jgi:hypothetical protein